MRVLIWSQHLLGTGHLQRSARLAAALAERGHSVVLANGGPAPATGPAGYARVDLPAIRAADARFSALVDDAGDLVAESLWRERARRLEALAEPSLDLVVVEMFPFGRRAFARELAPLLERWRHAPERPRRVVSLRDVLVEKVRPERVAEATGRVRRWFDRVLVHADPRLVALDASFPATREIAGWLRYTGYLAPTLPTPAAGRRGLVVSAGGGAVGCVLLAAAVDAARRLGPGVGPWTIIAGRGLPETAWQTLQASTPEGVELLRHVDDLPERLARAALSISQAGYNTVVEALALGCPMVLVPFAAGGETEQARRAAAVAGLGAATVVHESACTGEALAEAVAARLDAALPVLQVDVSGAARSARLLEALVEGRG